MDFFWSGDNIWEQAGFFNFHTRLFDASIIISPHNNSFVSLGSEFHQNSTHVFCCLLFSLHPRFSLLSCFPLPSSSHCSSRPNLTINFPFSTCWESFTGRQENWNLRADQHLTKICVPGMTVRCIKLCGIAWYLPSWIDTVDVILGDWHDTGAGLTENCLGWICIGTL